MRQLVSGDEAVALAARDAGFTLGAGCPGVPATAVLEALAAAGGRVQWVPNVKVALEVGLGVALAGGRALVPLERAAGSAAVDPLLAAACAGLVGALVVVTAADPVAPPAGSERRRGFDAAIPVLEPADAQEAYAFTLEATALSERYRVPVLVRTSPLVARTRSVVLPRPAAPPPPSPRFERGLPGRVVVPGQARRARERLRRRLEGLAGVAEVHPANRLRHGSAQLGIVAAGVARLHAREAAPDASLLELGLVHPLPLRLIRDFAEDVERCVVVEEGPAALAAAIRAAGVPVEATPEGPGGGELTVDRVRAIARRGGAAPAEAPAASPEPGVATNVVFEALARLGCILACDVGCYTRGALAPSQPVDALVGAGGAVGVGVGLRQALPEPEARRVVSVLGDTTFLEGGVPGLVGLVHAPPPTGHLVVVLDAEPGRGTARGGRLSIEALARSSGVERVDVVEPAADPAGFERLVSERLAGGEVAVLVARGPWAATAAAGGGTCR
jgi:indolepyruvate ferredoxin oxidoreductase alpha subunit